MLLDASADVGGQREVWGNHPSARRGRCNEEAIDPSWRCNLVKKSHHSEDEDEYEYQYENEYELQCRDSDSRDNNMTMQISFAAVGIDSSFCK